ncbi:uncharacterized protein ACN63O_007988 [Diretmus argenteus]
MLHGGSNCELKELKEVKNERKESNGYSVFGDGRETEHLEEDSLTDEGCVHSSEEEEEEEEVEEEEAREEEEEPGGVVVESDVVTQDSSGSRPLLLDSEDEEEQEPQVLLQPSPPTTPFPQNVSQPGAESARGAESVPDIFSKAPFRIGAQEDAGDVFANAPFQRAPAAAPPPLDVFLQAPFGKRKEAAGAAGVAPQPKSSYTPTVVHAVTPEHGVLGQVVQQPFRPQALAKYSRHFEGPLPQQPVAAHRVVSNVSRQAAVGSVAVGPLHSWTSEVSSVDPFVSAPFHLKAPQEKP